MTLDWTASYSFGTGEPSWRVKVAGTWIWQLAYTWGQH